ncbi:hypothetical protein DL766_002519 [Monosporascus sp. MC13-8B]|uniref:Uncharacterized protein n=1 Tax=Monosporascus cannonballus TaxID=155416 RepID=A0ABY0HGC8_9PEZI|nr:hypothetical protein DL762_001364 [Monosporascus cannonballus]RYP01023.1 hypothetical protein DL763_000444 [Monosporascus cannonballus]RYP35343.1 hypothetical protein DL766_002519 [Monosporascus sp. MC13-8B]
MKSNDPKGVSTSGRAAGATLASAKFMRKHQLLFSKIASRRALEGSGAGKGLAGPSPMLSGNPSGIPVRGNHARIKKDETTWNAIHLLGP